MMSAPLMEVAARVLDTIAGFPQLFCFLEIDATVAAATRSDGPVPISGVGPVLRSLLEAPGTSVAVVSAMPVADLEARLDVAGVHCVGMDGLQTRLPTGETVTAAGVDAIRAVLPAMRADLERELAGRDGVEVEARGVTLVCTSRGASRADAAVARWTAAAVTRQYRAQGARIVMREGRDGVEIRPDFADKGRAVRALLGQGGAALLPLYAADDADDEDGFVSLPPYAITIHIGGPGERTRARYRLADALEMYAFLAAVVRCRRR